MTYFKSDTHCPKDHPNMEENYGRSQACRDYPEQDEAWRLLIRADGEMLDKQYPSEDKPSQAFVSPFTSIPPAFNGIVTVLVLVSYVIDHIREESE